LEGFSALSSTPANTTPVTVPAVAIRYERRPFLVNYEYRITIDDAHTFTVCMQDMRRVFAFHQGENSTEVRYQVAPV